MNETFHHPHDALRTEIATYNCALEAVLRRRGLTLQLYKVVKGLVQLVAVLTLAYNAYLGADPLVVAVLVGSIVLGVETIETLIVEQAVEIAVEPRDEED